MAGICRENSNSSAVIPAKAGIRKLNAAAICRRRLKLSGLDSRLRGNDEGLGFLFLNFCFCENGKIFGSCMDNEILDGGNLSGKQQPLRRHSRESGNLETQSCKNLSEMTETQRTWIPAFAGMMGVSRE
ncbi:hypothetical protein I7Q86_05560 [Neisseria meningitidis]|uniref:hypothetical protein n=1 Tax=Neisseria bergeri TaxID=1906581 RepID=UPI0018D8091D|nr:hypothetical protein [Neisseria bergeri]MBH2355830.1 hypothetical protein [Neisseria meningitidis]MBH2430209.1 hypothetical protein [Neisseria meningitidis]MBH6061566.1 hypothetical protein [Neisseria meningitidis]